MFIVVQEYENKYSVLDTKDGDISDIPCKSLIKVPQNMLLNVTGDPIRPCCLFPLRNSKKLLDLRIDDSYVSFSGYRNNISRYYFIVERNTDKVTKIAYGYTDKKRVTPSFLCHIVNGITLYEVFLLYTERCMELMKVLLVRDGKVIADTGKYRDCIDISDLIEKPDSNSVIFDDKVISLN